MTADEAFEQCVKLLEGSADLHFAYSDPARDRYREPSPDRDKWKWSAEFLQDAANRIKKLRQESR
jgi:hypothetical protein